MTARIDACRRDPVTGTMPVRFPGRSSKKVCSFPEPEEKATAVVRAALSFDRSFPAETPPQSGVRLLLVAPDDPADNNVSSEVSSDAGKEPAVRFRD